LKALRWIYYDALNHIRISHRELKVQSDLPS